MEAKGASRASVVGSTRCSTRRSWCHSEESLPPRGVHCSVVMDADGSVGVGGWLCGREGGCVGVCFGRWLCRGMYGRVAVCDNFHPFL